MGRFSKHSQEFMGADEVKSFSVPVQLFALKKGLWAKRGQFSFVNIQIDFSEVLKMKAWKQCHFFAVSVKMQPKWIEVED